MQWSSYGVCSGEISDIDDTIPNKLSWLMNPLGCRAEQIATNGIRLGDTTMLGPARDLDSNIDYSYLITKPPPEISIKIASLASECCFFYKEFHGLFKSHMLIPACLIGFFALETQNLSRRRLEP